MRAFLSLRYTVPERRAAFEKGLQRLGYEVIHGLPAGDISPSDVLCCWNRIGHVNEVAKKFSKVLVCENASWGNDFQGDHWYTIARNYHNTRGMFPIGDKSRWDSLRVELAPWRKPGGETVVLPSRGIGSPPTVMPRGWTAPGRVRPHMGKQSEFVPLERDLAHASKVITWGSGAAVKALMWGIPVESHMPNWIAACEPTDHDRLRMFRQLAWATWTLKEIEKGTPFSWLLQRPEP